MPCHSISLFPPVKLIWSPCAGILLDRKPQPVTDFLQKQGTIYHNNWFRWSHLRQNVEMNQVGTKSAEWVRYSEMEKWWSEVISWSHFSTTLYYIGWIVVEVDRHHPQLWESQMALACKVKHLPSKMATSGVSKGMMACTSSRTEV